MHIRISRSPKLGLCRWTVAVALLAFVPMAASQAPEQGGFGRREPAGNMSIADALNEGLEAIKEAEDAQKAGDNTKAIEAGTKAFTLANYVFDQDQLNVTAGYILGRYGLLNGRPREALTLMEKYVADPAGVNDWYARKLLGDIYYVSYAEHARTQYMKALELAPNEPDVHYGLAKTYLKLTDPDKALEHAERAIALDQEGRPEFQAVRASALAQMPDRLDDAVAAAREAVRVAEVKVRENPGEPKHLDMLAQQYDLLLNMLQTVHQYYPERVDVVIEATQVIQDQADLNRLLSYHSALKMVEQQLERMELQTEATKLVDLMFVEAQLDRIVGSDDKAVEVLKRIIELKPDHEQAKELLEIIQPTEEQDMAASAE